MSRRRRAARPDVQVTFEVSQDGPPGDLSPLVNLLITRGLRAMDHGDAPQPGSRPEGEGQSDQRTIRLYVEEAEEKPTRRTKGSRKAARPKPRNPKPRKRRLQP